MGDKRKRKNEKESGSPKTKPTASPSKPASQPSSESPARPESEPPAAAADEISDADFKRFVMDSINKILKLQESNEGRLAALEKFQGETSDQLSQIDKVLDSQEEDIVSVIKENKAMKSEVENLKQELKQTKFEMENVTEKINKLERFSRRNNLRVYGLRENEKENSKDVLMMMERMVAEKFQLQRGSIQRAHRLGPAARDKDRPIIMKMANWQDKMLLLTTWKRQNLGPKIRISDDLTEADYALKKSYHPVMEQAFKAGKKVKFSDGRLYIDGTIYRGC